LVRAASFLRAPCVTSPRNPESFAHVVPPRFATPRSRGHMPATDWNAANKAPEYPPAAGAKVSTDAHPVTESKTEARQGVCGHTLRSLLLFSVGGPCSASRGVF